MNSQDIPEEKAEKVGKIAALVILFIAAIVIFSMMYRTFSDPGPDGKIPEYQRIKIESYCLLHKVRPQVIEINANGRMFYALDNGKRAEIR
jgi:hypothetical protein